MDLAGYGREINYLIENGRIDAICQYQIHMR